MERLNRIIIYGQAVKGLKESFSFTEIPWVKEQLISKLGLNPYPGTFNLEIQDRNSLNQLKQVKKREGVEIVPREKGFCRGRCYPVIVADRIEGAMVVPEVVGYPDSKVEIIAPCNLREALAVTDGDRVKVEIMVKEEKYSLSYRREIMALYRDLFNFSTKVGCLEGYLHEREDANISTMPNWVGNIEKMYGNLPIEVKKDLFEDYRNILEKILQSYEKILNKDDEVLKKLKRMFSELERKGN